MHAGKRQKATDGHVESRATNDWRHQGPRCV